MKPEKLSSFNLQKINTENRLLGLWQFVHGFQHIYFTATLSLAIAAVSKTGTYMLVREFADRLAAKEDIASLLPFFAGGFLLLAACEGGFTFLSGKLAAFTAEGATLRLRNYLFDHIQRLTFTYHDKTQTGELIQRATSDVEALRRFFSEQAIGVGRIILLFSINLIALLKLSPKLALSSIIVVPFILVTSIFFFKRVTRAYEVYQEQEAALSTKLQENLTGVRVVKAFARQDYEREKFEKENWKKFLSGKKLLTMHAFFWPISDIFCGAQMLAGFYIGARMAIAGEITPGTYLAYAGLIVWLIWPLRNLGRLIVQTSTGLVSFERVMQIIRQQREDLETGEIPFAGRIRGELIFNHVGFAYEDGAQALHDISFKVNPGTVIALLGPTGSGKTTLVHLLPRFYDYTSGQIMLDGRDLKSYPRKFLRQQIGIVEQEPFLFSRTIRENILYGVERDTPQEQIEAAARAAALHDVIMSFPEGYQTLVGEKGVTLSGGQKQRLAIARTLLKNPAILILDDSTSSVDTETEVEIRHALQGLMKGRTTFIIAHRIQSVMDADLILILAEGRVIQQGAHKELIAQDGIYRQIYEIQTRIEEELEHEISSAEKAPS